MENGIQYVEIADLEIDAASGGTIGRMLVDSSDGKLKFISPDGDVLIAEMNHSSAPGRITFVER